jgi:hypothetical protein
MATRSLIAKALPNGEFQSIYCHYDGYPDYNGKILDQHYTDPEKIDKLLALGDLSTLAPELGDEPHDFNNCPDGICNFYGRDRKETDVDAQTHISMVSLNKRANACDANYVYLFIDGKWKYSGTTSKIGLDTFSEL